MFEKVTYAQVLEAYQAIVEHQKKKPDPIAYQNEYTQKLKNAIDTKGSDLTNEEHAAIMMPIRNRMQKASIEYNLEQESLERILDNLVQLFDLSEIPGGDEYVKVYDEDSLAYFGMSNALMYARTRVDAEALFYGALRLETDVLPVMELERAHVGAYELRVKTDCPGPLLTKIAYNRVSYEKWLYDIWNKFPNIDASVLLHNPAVPRNKYQPGATSIVQRFENVED